MIPLVDLKVQYASIRGEIDAAVHAVLGDCRFYQGPHVEAFERSFAGFLGAEHCVGVGSCTDALYLTLRALRVGAGDEVIVPAMTFIATAEAVSMTGATPVFVDMDPRTANIDVRLIEDVVTEKTKAIIPVHLAGRAVWMDEVYIIADKRGLAVVEDCAQAAGAMWNGKRVGTFGEAGCFSFYPSKNLGAYGDGGAVVTSSESLARTVRMLADHGRERKFDHELIGVCSRLDGLQAAVLRAKLPHLDSWNLKRNMRAVRYTELLADVPGVELPDIPEDWMEHVFHCFMVRVEKRGAVAEAMRARGIEVGYHYPVPVPLTKAYAHMGHKPWHFTHAYSFANECLTLPLYPELTDAHMETVVNALSEAVRA